MENLRVIQKDHLISVTLNRPKVRNAFNDAMIEEKESDQASAKKASEKEAKNSKDSSKKKNKKKAENEKANSNESSNKKQASRK